MKKLISSGLVVALLCGALSGCGGAAPSAGTAAAGTEAAAAGTGAEAAGTNAAAETGASAASEAAGAAASAESAAAASSAGEASSAGTGASEQAGLRIEDGALQPFLEVSNLRAADYSNENSDILRFCVYVETDHDTDNDGKADLLKALVQVPRPAVEGVYKAGVIYDPTPYCVGTFDGTRDPSISSYKVLYREKRFDYDSLYRPCSKREPEGEMSSMDAALSARPAKDWNYIAPVSGQLGFWNAAGYNYYLARGYAIVTASGIGTYGSEGFELCGTHLERDSHAAVVEWLAGKRKAYTDRTNNIEIKADWCNGNVAMTGCSYGGTLPFSVATTGVEGLKTIIPYAGIASWYDYTPESRDLRPLSPMPASPAGMITPTPREYPRSWRSITRTTSHPKTAGGPSSTGTGRFPTRSTAPGCGPSPRISWRPMGTMRPYGRNPTMRRTGRGSAAPR